MTLAPAVRLEDAASRDAAVAPLARLQAIALRALEDDPSWRAAAASVALERVATDRPLLDATEVRVDRAAAQDLLARLAAPAGIASVTGIDAVALIEATGAQSDERLEAIAASASLEPERLMPVAHVLAWPLLLALGERTRELTLVPSWRHGHCPACAAWPLLAEMRGLDRERVLRCGRCASGWPSRHAQCAFCGNTDHRTLTYLASEDQRESRRAQVCARCQGYLKGIATLRTLDAAGLALADLDTLPLDLAAAEAGYARPRDPAVRLDLRIVAA